MVNSSKISDLRPDVAQNATIFVALCRAEGLNVKITQTMRDDAYQKTLYQKGYAKTPYTTFHGQGLAFDICKNVRGHEYDDLDFFAQCAKIGKRMGFTWGGDWKSFPDRPHFQWDEHKKYSGTMVRAGKLPPTMPRYEEDDEMDIQKFKELMREYRAELQDNDSSKWSKEAREWAVKNGIVTGGTPMPDGQPNYMWEDLLTREQMATLLYRFAKLMGKA